MYEAETNPGTTHHAVLWLEVDEAEVDLVAGEPTPVVDAHQDVVFAEDPVHDGHAALQFAVQLNTHRHKHRGQWAPEEKLLML